MSVLQAQADQLRDNARTLRMLSDGLQAPYVVPSTKETMWLAMRDAANRMEDAADTITRLRDMAQGAQAENERLRVRLEVADPICKQAQSRRTELRRCQAENDRLRELVRDMWHGMCAYGHDCRGCEHHELHEGQRFVGECEYHRRMRELGIEAER